MHVRMHVCMVITCRVSPNPVGYFFYLNPGRVNYNYPTFSALAMPVKQSASCYTYLYPDAGLCSDFWALLIVQTPDE